MNQNTPKPPQIRIPPSFNFDDLLHDFWLSIDKLLDFLKRAIFPRRNQAIFLNSHGPLSTALSFFIFEIDLSMMENVGKMSCSRKNEVNHWHDFPHPLQLHR